MGVELQNGPALKKRLLALPVATWEESEEWWDALLIVPIRKQHDSGYAHIAFIGVNGDVAEKILGYPDAFRLPAWTGLPERQNDPSLGDWGVVQADAYFPSGILRIFSRDWEFQAAGLYSIEIKLRPRKKVS